MNGSEPFDALFENMPQLGWAANADGWIYYYNRRWYEYTGTTPKEMEGWGWQSVHDPRLLPTVLIHWRRSIDTGEPFEMTFPLRSHDGAFRWFLTRVNPMRDETGKIIRWVGINTDVDDQKRAEETAAEARTRAEEASRTKDEFLAMLGHELRNPLAPIVTALQLIDLKGDPGLARERAVIRRQVQHLERLVDDLLDVSRITRGKISLQRQRVEITSIVAQAIEVASPLLEQSRHKLEIAVPQDLAVDGDPTRLAQVVANILTNAAKYTPAEGHIWIRAETDGKDIVIAIRDNGMGIAAETLPQIFDLFVQSRQAIDRAQGGLGLGLAIVRSLVGLHGGTVEARSEGAGKGTEFTVRLPKADALLSAVAPPGSRSSPPTAPEGFRILIVDDNEDAAMMTAEFLRISGYEVRIAGDGPAGLEQAAVLRPDAILLDLGLPVMDGFEVARRLRELPGIRAALIVAVTGYGQPDDRARTKAAGFDMHLVKPIDIDALEKVLREQTARAVRAE